MSDSATMSVRALHRTDLPKLSLSTKAAATVLAIVAAVALPQLFHVIGAVSGQGTMLGVAFLPMHLPIIFVGLIAGPAFCFSVRERLSTLIRYSVSIFSILLMVCSVLNTVSTSSEFTVRTESMARTTFS